MKKVFKFKTTLQRPDGLGTWHYADTPIRVEKEFGVKGKLPISGKLNGIDFKATLIPRGNGEHYLVLDKNIRTKAKIEIDDSIEMEIWKDNSKRKVIVPNDFKVRLSKIQKAESFFQSLAYSYQKAYIDWINAAKKEETRVIRIEKSMSLLENNRKSR